MKTIGRDEARLLAGEALAALQAVAERHGVTVRARGNIGMMGGTSCTVGFEFAAQGEGGQAGTAEAICFKQFARVHGLDPELLGRDFQSGGRKFTVAGLNTRAPRRPVICIEARSGKRYSFGTEVARLISAKEQV